MKTLDLRPDEQSVGFVWGCIVSVNCHIGDLGSSHEYSLTQVAQPSATVGRRQTAIAQLSWLLVQVHLASRQVKSPLNTVVLDWIKGVEWLIASCRLCFSSPIAGQVGNRGANVILKMFCPSWDGIVVHAAHLQKGSPPTQRSWCWPKGLSDFKVAQKIQNGVIGPV